MYLPPEEASAAPVYDPDQFQGIGEAELHPLLRPRARTLEALLRRRECDPFARLPGTPALAELAAGNRPVLRLCQEVRLKWAPARHKLFHPAHRSTVLCVMLVVRRSRQHRGFAWGWMAEIPTEIFFVIAEHLGRFGWPNGGRDALPLEMPRRT